MCCRRWATGSGCCRSRAGQRCVRATTRRCWQVAPNKHGRVAVVGLAREVDARPRACRHGARLCICTTMRACSASPRNCARAPRRREPYPARGRATPVRPRATRRAPRCGPPGVRGSRESGQKARRWAVSAGKVVRERAAEQFEERLRWLGASADEIRVMGIVRRRLMSRMQLLNEVRNSEERSLPDTPKTSDGDTRRFVSPKQQASHGPTTDDWIFYRINVVDVFVEKAQVHLEERSARYRVWGIILTMLAVAVVVLAVGTATWRWVTHTMLMGTVMFSWEYIFITTIVAFTFFGLAIYLAVVRSGGRVEAAARLRRRSPLWCRTAGRGRQPPGRRRRCG